MTIAQMLYSRIDGHLKRIFGTLDYAEIEKVADRWTEEIDHGTVERVSPSIFAIAEIIALFGVLRVPVHEIDLKKGTVLCKVASVLGPT